jgi:hypothetical protein
MLMREFGLLTGLTFHHRSWRLYIYPMKQIGCVGIAVPDSRPMRSAKD